MVVYVPATQEKDLQKVILSLQQLSAGRSNATGTVTLSTGTSTIVSSTGNFTQSGIIASGSVPHLVPTSTATWAEPWGISSVGKDTFTITHSGSTAVRTFLWTVQG